MAINITDSFVRQYEDNFEHLASQLTSKLRAAVTEKAVTGKDFNVERLDYGNVTMSTVASRHAATTVSDMTHSRRVGFLKSYADTVMFDEEDKIRLLADPTNDYLTQLSASFNRTIDAVIIEALLEDANTGETGSTTQSLGSGQVIAHGSAGLTLAKLKQANRILAANDVDMDREELFLVTNAHGMEDLMTDTGVTSIDNVNFKTNESGRIETRLAGFKIIECNQMINAYAGTGDGGAASSSNRPAIAFAKSAIRLGVGMDKKLQLAQRTENNMNWGLYLKASFGAVRTHEEKVVDIRFQQ